MTTPAKLSLDTGINLRDLVILIADPNAYLRRVTVGMLRGFGANKLIEVGSSVDLAQALTGQRVDVLLCDTRLTPQSGLEMTQSIRRNPQSPHRTIPIMLLSSDTSEKIVKQARDSGANMVIAKPMSPRNLYDRLCWITFHPRPFVDAETYFGPDRRFKIEGYPNGIGRRKGDMVEAIAAEEGPALAQDDIDSLFSATRSGRG